MQYKHAVINTNSKAGNAQPGGSGGARAPPIFWENFITLHLGPLNDYCVAHALSSSGIVTSIQSKMLSDQSGGFQVFRFLALPSSLACLATQGF